MLLSEGNTLAHPRHSNPPAPHPRLRQKPQAANPEKAAQSSALRAATLKPKKSSAGSPQRTGDNLGAEREHES